MTLYTCPRCNYETNDKCSIRRHYMRKVPCKARHKDVSLEECLRDLEEKKKPTCQYCNKFFTRKSSLTRHQEKCKNNHIEMLKKNNEDNLRRVEEYEKRLAVVDEKPKKISDDQFVYLLKTREFINSGESTYKIGKTVDPKERLSSYPKGSRVYFLVKVKDCHRAEQELIGRFDEKFRRMKEYGKEYFEGNVDVMIEEIVNYLRK